MPNPPAFTCIERPQPKWLQFLIQAIAVPILVEGCVLVTLIAGDLVSPSLARKGAAYEVLIDGALITSVAFLGGWTLARINPVLIAAGRWIWMPALVFLVTAIASDLRVLPQYYGGSYKAVLAADFSNYGGGIVLGLYPVCSTLAYSLAMFLVSRKLARHEQSDPNSIQ